MNILVLGQGKTGALAAELARDRKHTVSTLGSSANLHASALTPQELAPFDVVIDFTTPHAVLENIEACTRAGKPMAVGTTGWYAEKDTVRRRVEQAGTGLVFAANFSVGVNMFFDVVRAGSAALQHRYLGQIFERHHVHKKDAPSGTAIAIQRTIKDACGHEVEIISFREGDVVGMHEVTLDSPNDTIYLCHDAKSRRGFAEGAVRAAEWVVGRKGFFDFKDVWREL